MIHTVVAIVVIGGGVPVPDFIISRVPVSVSVFRMISSYYYD